MATSALSRIAPATLPPPTRYRAFDLGQNPWKLGCTIGVAPPPRERLSPSGDVARLQQESARAQQRFGLPEEGRVGSGYEAGRDGCWRHRSVVAPDVQHSVSDSASLEGKRRPRRAPPERLEVRKLLTRRRRHSASEKKVWSVGRVPSVEADDRRQLHRELPTAKPDRTRGIHRLKGLCAGPGVQLAWPGDVDTQLNQVHPWDGAPLPSALRTRLQRAWQQGGVLTAPRQTREAERRALLRRRDDPVIAHGRQLCTRRGMGVHSAGL